MVKNQQGLLSYPHPSLPWGQNIKLPPLGRGRLYQGGHRTTSALSQIYSFPLFSYTQFRLQYLQVKLSASPGSLSHPFQLIVFLHIKTTKPKLNNTTQNSVENNANIIPIMPI